MYWLKIVLLLAAVISAQQAIAEGHEEAGAAVPAKDYSGKQTEEWEKIQTQLNSLKTKVDAQEAVVKTLVAEKSHMEPNAAAAKVEELKKEYTKLERLTDEYNQLNADYLTKFPERGIKEKRVYTRMKLKALDAYEEDLSVQGRVNKLQKKILTQYPKANQVDVQKKATNKKSNSAQASSQDSSKKDVTDPITFEK